MVYLYEIKNCGENLILDIVNSLDNYNCRVQKNFVEDLIKLDFSLSNFLLNRTSQPHCMLIFRDTNMHIVNIMKKPNYLKVVYKYIYEF